jgi:hypothetical protein
LSAAAAFALRGSALPHSTHLTVTVSVALSVGAPVMVAALGNRNEIVKVFDAVRR